MRTSLSLMLMVITSLTTYYFATGNVLCGVCGATMMIAAVLIALATDVDEYKRGEQQ